MKRGIWTKIPLRGIILYILVDAKWCNSGDVPDVFEFKLSMGAVKD